MTEISISELGANVDKYVTMSREQNIAITKNGKVVAKLVGEMEKEQISMDWFDKEMMPTDKEDAFRRLMALIPEGGIDLDPEQVREERLRRKAELD